MPINEDGEYLKTLVLKKIRSEVVIEAEVAAHVGRGSNSSRGAASSDLSSGFFLLEDFLHDTCLLVVTDTLLEEVGLASKRDVLHEVEGVGGIVDLGVAKSKEEAVSDKLDVLAHQVRVHAEKSAWQCFCQELLLDGDGLGNDVLNGLLAGLVSDLTEQQAGEVGVHTLITRDELVGEGQTRHETTFLEPEDGGESAREEDTLDCCEGDEPGGKSGVLVSDPSQCPISLLLDARD